MEAIDDQCRLPNLLTFVRLRKGESMNEIRDSTGRIRVTLRSDLQGPLEHTHIKKMSNAHHFFVLEADGVANELILSPARSTMV